MSRTYNDIADTEIFFDGSMVAQTRFLANREHLYSDLQGEAVILSLKTGKYYGVNAVGASIWTILQKPKNLQQIQAKLLEEFAVDEAVCRREVTAFLKKMTEEGLIEITDEEVL